MSNFWFFDIFRKFWKFWFFDFFVKILIFFDFLIFFENLGFFDFFENFWKFLKIFDFFVIFRKKKFHQNFISDNTKKYFLILTSNIDSYWNLRRQAFFQISIYIFFRGAWVPSKKFQAEKRRFLGIFLDIGHHTKMGVSETKLDYWRSR